jgi:V8-like Glu-specific endopeptidase
VKALLALAAVLLNASVLPDDPIQTNPAKSVHMITCPVDKDSYVVGTGSYVDAHTVITAAHVAADRTCFVEGERALLVYVNKKLDIAVLWTPAEGEGRIPISCRKPRDGEAFHVYGYPNAEPLQKRVFLGTGKFVPADEEFPGMAIFDGASTPGQSGSAILDSHNRIIGVLNAGNDVSMLGRLLRNTYLCKPATAS